MRKLFVLQGLQILVVCTGLNSWMIYPSLAADEVPPFTSFVTSVSGITSAANEMLQNERSTARITLIKQEFTTQFLSSVLGNKKIQLAKLSPTELLCGVRGRNETLVRVFSSRDPNANESIDHINNLARTNFLNTSMTGIQSVGTSTAPTELIPALKLLFANYTVKASNEALTEEKLKKLRDVTLARCQADLNEFDVAYYGKKIESPQNVAPAPSAGAIDLSILGPVGVLIDTVIGIFTPVVVETAKIVDQDKRRNAIKIFLEKHGDELIAAGKALGRAVSDYTFTKRLSYAGAFSEQIATLKTVSVDLSKVAKCDDVHILDHTAGSPPNDSFLVCYSGAWRQLQESVGNLAKTASDYDGVADAGDTNTATRNFEKITNNFDAIKNSNFATPNDKDAYWQNVTELVAFTSAVSTAFSSDNRKKLHQAIDDALK